MVEYSLVPCHMFAPPDVMRYLPSASCSNVPFALVKVFMPPKRSPTCATTTRDRV
ncbi:Uncharacterised protein [Mycobacteroides abscessus]|nr:Uncharacterised protein [Mycobacteroides abscessus]